MPTITEIAKMTGFSVTTVSIVLRGDAKKRNISDATVDKIVQAAREIGYTTNVAARRLRNQDVEQATIVAVLWSDDFRSSLMVRFLRGIKRAMISNGIKCELRVVPYQPGKLEDVFQLSLVASINGAIICNASYEDLEYLKKDGFNLPIVLYNRSSDNYSSVVIDNKELGKIPYEIFRKHGKRKMIILDYVPSFPGKDDRVGSFLKLAKQDGLEVEMIECAENTSSSAYEVCVREIEKIRKADAMFVTSDIVAIGAMRALYQHKIAVPEKVELISIGIGDPEMCSFQPVSISTVELPMEEMARNCLITLMDQMLVYRSDPVRKKMKVSFVERESCSA